MAKNTGNDYRKGAVTARTQFQQPNGGRSSIALKAFLSRKAPLEPCVG